MKTFLALIVALITAAASFAQTLPNAVPMPSAVYQFFDSTGAPLAGGLLYTCVAGTTCPGAFPLATYTDSTANTQLSNPIVLDSAGRAQIWIGPAPYKLVLENANNVQLWTQDNVMDVSLFFANYVKSIGLATLINYTGAGTGGITRNVSAGLLDFIKAADYGAVCDGTTDDSAHIQAAITYSGTMPGLNRTVLLPGGICRANITLGQNQSITGAGLGTAAPDGPGQMTQLQDISGGAAPVITITSGTSYAGVHNVKLIGNGTDAVGPTDRGIYSANSNYLEIENVACATFAEECIRWEAGVAARMVRITADGTLSNRTRLAHSGAIYVGSNAFDGFIIDVEVGASLQTEGHSISSNCYNDAIVIAGAATQLINAHGETSELGLYAPGLNNFFTNSTFDLNYCSGAWVTGGGNQFATLWLLRNGKDGNGAWDAMEVSGVNNQFVNVNIDQTSGAPTLTYGITDLASSGAANYNQFVNVRAFSIVGPLWHVANGGPEIVYGAKDSVPIADGTSSPTLTGFINFFFSQSTPLTITSFTGGTPGQEACFLGNSNVTFGTGGNIKPPNGIAQPLQASMIYCYRNLSGTWYWLNTDNNPQFNNVTAPLATITDATIGHLHGVTGSPGIAVTNCGAGCGASIRGTDLAGNVTINTGTGVPNFAVAVTITWTRTYQGFGAICVVSPASTVALSGGVMPVMSMGPSGSGTSILFTSSIGLAGSTTYVYSYVCTQAQ